MKIQNIVVKNTQIPLLYEKNTLGISCLKLVFKVAGSVENSKLGLANLCAKILGEGTKKDGIDKFYDELEKRAINLEIHCDFETFSISINYLNEHFKFALNALKNLLCDPNLTQNTLEKLQFLINSEISSLNSDFDYLTNNELNAILYPNTPLSYPKIGTSKSINSITLSDVKEFLRLNLDLSNLFIVMSADIDAKDVNFADILSPLDEGIVRILRRFEPVSECKKSYIKKDSNQAFIYFGAPFNCQIDEYHLANLALFVLGSSGFGSRLMEEIRVKRGLAYSIYAMKKIELSHTQIWGYLQTKNESKYEVCDIIEREFEKFIKKGISENELNMAKKFLLGYEPLQKETLFNRLKIAQWEFYMGQKQGFSDEILSKISSTKLSAINGFIKSHDEITKLSFSILTNEI